MYSDGRGRLWDLKTREFWRSLSLDKAEELLREGGWFNAYVRCVPVLVLPFISFRLGRGMESVVFLHPR
jgi:hypothetical protein